MKLVDNKGIWEITNECIKNLITGEVRNTINTPLVDRLIALPTDEEFYSCCEYAFKHGEWQEHVAYIQERDAPYLKKYENRNKYYPADF